MIRRLTVACLSAVLIAVACSVPEDASPEILDPEILPVVATPTPAASSTVTRTIYLFSDDTGLLFPVTREVEAPVRVSTLLGELTEQVTPEEAENSLSSPMPPNTILFEAATVSDGLAVLSLSRAGLPDLQGDLLLQALAQLVWTLTEEGNGIDRIALRVEDDEQNSWPVSDEGDSPPAQTLDRSDYSTFDPDFVEPVEIPEPTQVPIEEGEPDPPPEDDGG